MINKTTTFLPLLLILLLSACAAPQVRECPVGTQNLPGCPPLNAVNDETINQLYKARTWVPPDKLTINPIEVSEEAKVPINTVRAKLIGPTYDDSLTSLAAKIWLIEHAQHTIDLVYYIFSRDLVGYAVLGALCNAVQRGVDVRIMVDSLGSIHPGHNELRALETCADEAGFMRNANGQLTTKKTRVQVVIFNAITKFRFNRRSHDKLLVVDGFFPDNAAVMTGGRNISVDYYGIHEDGTKDPTAFRDLEILLRAGTTDQSDKVTVGVVSELYYTLLFLHKGNRRIYPVEDDDEDPFGYAEVYAYEREKGQKKLAFLKSLPAVQKRLQEMPSYMRDEFRTAEVRLVHQLHNLTAQKVTTHVVENVEKNPNSILYLLRKVADKAIGEGLSEGTLRIVSPYLFSGLYRDEQGEVVYDGAKNILNLLHENPGVKLDVITNSVMTSDNFFTQSIIDMEMVPRFLLTPDLQKVWLSKPEEGEFNPKLVNSEEWRRVINNPQIFIYETGKLDSNLLGGNAYYGKLHAKFILGEKVCFIGTSNFDYRSNLYNNEMGFLFRSPELRQDLLKVFDWLKASAYRWGTPQWLQMRKKLMAADTKKSGPARRQRSVYKTIRALGLEYLM